MWRILAHMINNVYLWILVVRPEEATIVNAQSPLNLFDLVDPREWDDFNGSKDGDFPYTRETLRSCELELDDG